MPTNNISDLSLLTTEKLPAKTIGAKILVYDTVISTNELAAELARKGDFVEGQAIFADEQTAGAGRMGRNWFAPKGKSILMSAILTPRLETRHLPAVNAVGALAVVDAIEEMTSLIAKVRWPNDVVLDDKKIAGVLAKIENVNRPGQCFILGIGFNVNVSEDEFPPDMPPATSLLIHRKGKVDRLKAAESLLRSLDRWYETLKAGNYEAIEARLRERSSLIGNKVTVKCGGESVTGTAVGISLIDGLTLALPDGSTRTFHESTATLVS